MFVTSFIHLALAFVITYLAHFLYNGPPSTGNQLSDWISFFILNGPRVLIMIIAIHFTILLLEKPTKYIKTLLFTKTYKIEIWKAVILVLLIFDIYFYLVIKFSWFLLFPFALYFLGKVLMAENLTDK